MMMYGEKAKHQIEQTITFKKIPASKERDLWYH